MKKLLSIIVFSLLLSANAYADLYKAKSFNCVYYHTSIGEIKNNKYILTKNATETSSSKN